MDEENDEIEEHTRVDRKVTAAPEEDEADDEPKTAVRHDVVPIDAPAVNARALKATLDLEDERKQALDDGWGSPIEDTHSRTGSSEVVVPDDAQTRGHAVISAPPEPAVHAAPHPEEEDPDAPRLICIQGPDMGREFVLKGRDVSIGRATDNDVVLNDPSVSRLHCRILIDEGQYVATDQRSGNGTVVNGRRIERQSLQSGNTLKMGQTILRFVEMGDVIKSTETAQHLAEEAERSARTQEPITNNTKPSRHKPLSRPALYIVATALALAIVIVAVAIASRQSTSPEIGHTPAEIAEGAIADADIAIAAKKLSIARDKYALAKGAAPEDPRVAALLSRLEREERTLTALDQSKQQAAANAFDDALHTLDTIAKDTQFTSDVVATRVEIERAKEELKKKTPTPKVDHHDKPDRPEPKPQPSKADAGVTQKAMDAFVSGQADNALDLLSGAQLDDTGLALKNKITKFQDVYVAANDAVTNKKADADAQVKKALAFESKIAQGKSVYATQLRRLHGDAAYETGVRLMQEQKMIEAYRAFKEAPDVPQAKKKLTEITTLARDVFNQGYILKDSDRSAARDKWQRVLTMVPPEDDSAVKARKWLDQTK